MSDLREPESSALPPGWTPGPPPIAAPVPPGATAPGAGLHPLDVNRAVSATVSMVRFRWRQMFGVTLLLLGPVYLALALFNATFGARLAEWSLAWQMGALEPGFDFSDLPPFPTEALVLSLALGLLASLVSVIATAALVHVVVSTYQGTDATAGRAVRAAAGRWASLAGSYLLLMLSLAAIAIGGAAVAVGLIVLNATPSGVQPGIAVLLGLVAMVATVVALIFVVLRWAMLAQAVMIDGSGALEALGTSWRVVAGSGWRVLGYVLLVGVGGFIVGLVVSVIALVVGLDPLAISMRFDPLAQAAQVLVGAVASVLVMPFAVTLLTLLYLDLRWRRGTARPPAGRSA